MSICSPAPQSDGDERVEITVKFPKADVSPYAGLYFCKHCAVWILYVTCKVPQLLRQEHRGGSNFMNACDRNVQRVKLTERIWGLSLSLAFKRSWQAGVSCAAPTEGSVQTICYQ